MSSSTEHALGRATEVGLARRSLHRARRRRDPVGTIDVEIGNSRFRLALGNWSAVSGLARIGFILDKLSETAYNLQASPRATEKSRTKHREAPMSFRADSSLTAEIYAAVIPVFARTREFMSNGLIHHAIKPRRRPKKGKSGSILQIPC